MNMITRTLNDQIAVLEVTGAIDGRTAPALRESILAACSTGQLFLLDMHHVHFMSSAGLRVMLVLRRQLQQNDGRVILVGLLDPIYDAMDATGFLKYFETAPDLETGAQLLRA